MILKKISLVYGGGRGAFLSDSDLLAAGKSVVAWFGGARVAGGKDLLCLLRIILYLPLEV